MTRIGRWTMIAGLALGSIAFIAPLLAGPPTQGHLIMKSDEGDFIGLGENYNLRQPPWSVVVWVAPWDQSVTIDFFPPNWPADSGKWLLRFSMPGGGPLEEGLYDDVSRWVPAPASEARMWIAGEHRGCNRVSGWFLVRSAEYDDMGWPTYLDIVFQQHCELDADAALSGRLRWGHPGKGSTPSARP